ncbi:hypothetical protein R3P38DRAFT_3170447 [Favolaschia claudopus]|uniref:ATP synthase F0 subunit 8 n=1 Tax=Favolaschia claudopus TaxID=2862362 RepID=A0AAW0DX21_9AGAR
MSSTGVFRTLPIIFVVAVGLASLQYAAFYILHLLRSLAIIKQLVMFFAASATVTLLFKRLAKVSDPGNDSDSNASDETGSEPDSLFDEVPYWRSGGKSSEQLPGMQAGAPSLSTISSYSQQHIPASKVIPGTVKHPSPAPSFTNRETLYGPSAQLFNSQWFAAELAKAQLTTSAPNYYHPFYSRPAFSAPASYAFAARSSFLSEYVYHLSKRAVRTPYRYIPSVKRSTNGYRSSFPQFFEDERFPVMSGLTFPDAIPTATPLPQRPLPKRAGAPCPPSVSFASGTVSPTTI